jgi:hypothetical protein
MNRKRNGNDYERTNFAERQRWKWEWLRRNKEYREDYNKYGKDLQKAWKQYNDIAREMIEEGEPPDWYLPDPPYDKISLEMGTKWGMRELPDPYNPPQETPRIALNMTSVFARVSNDLFSLSEMGSILEKPKPHDRSRADLDSGWTIWRADDKSEFPETLPLTSENCPHYLMIVARVDPWIQKTRLTKAINQCANENLDKLLKAQRSFFQKKSLRPRFVEFETHKNVYDLREKGKSWRQITKEILPDEKDPEVAMRRVRYYYDQAKWWINGGWRVL